MVLRSLYCWGTKLVPFLQGRAMFLGAGTPAASLWTPGRRGLRCVCSKDQGKGGSRIWALWCGVAQWVAQPGASPMGAPCGQTWCVPAWGTEAALAPQFPG